MPAIELRPYRAGSDRARVHALFEDPAFYFKTHLPALTAAEEIDELINDETRLIEAGGTLVGLAEMEVVGLNFASHYRLHIQFSRSTPMALRVAAFDCALRDLTGRKIVSRLSFGCYAFDEAGIALARSAGLRCDGALRGMVRLHGRTYDAIQFSKLFGRSLDSPLPAERPWPDVMPLPPVAAALRALRAQRDDFSNGSWPVGELLSCARDPRIAELRLANFGLLEPGAAAGRRFLVWDDRFLVLFSDLHVVHRTARLQICATGEWQPLDLGRALAAAVSCAFDVYNLHKVYGLVTETQAAARPLLTAAGFEPELTIPHAMAAHGRTFARDLWSNVHAA